MEEWVLECGGNRVENAQPTWWSKQSAAHLLLDHVITHKRGGLSNSCEEFVGAKA